MRVYRGHQKITNPFLKASGSTAASRGAVGGAVGVRQESCGLQQLRSHQWLSLCCLKILFPCHIFPYPITLHVSVLVKLD